MTSVIGVGANGAQGRTERAPRHAQTQPTCPVDHGVHHLLGLLSVRVRDALSGDAPPAREEASCQAVRRGEANPPPPALFPLALLNRCRVGPVVQVSCSDAGRGQSGHMLARRQWPQTQIGGALASPAGKKPAPGARVSGCQSAGCWVPGCWGGWAAPSAWPRLALAPADGGAGLSPPPRHVAGKRSLAPSWAPE